MVSSDPNVLPTIPGAVLSDRDIRLIVRQGKILLKTPISDKSQDFYDPNQFDNAIEDQRENPSGCLESAGYRMQPEAYWSGSDFIPIDHGGYKLKPYQHAVVRTLQWIKLSEDYCAFHFGLHHNQMVGISIGAGQIQPEWGPAPLYLTIWNSGKADFVIRKDEPLSRLVFLHMTSSTVTGRSTRERVVRESIKEDLAEQTAKERAEKLRILGLYGLGIIIVIGAFFGGPLLFPFLSATPRINSTYGGLLAGALGFLLLHAIGTWKGHGK